MNLDLDLDLCPLCEGDRDRGLDCRGCQGSGIVHAASGEPFWPPSPWDEWAPRQLVNLSRHSRGLDLVPPPTTPSTTWRDALSRPRTTPAAAPEPRPHRLSLSEILQLVLQKGPADHSTVRLARNAKGDTQVDVSVRTGEAGLETVEAAAAKARELYDDLCGAYPMKGGE